MGNSCPAQTSQPSVLSREQPRQQKCPKWPNPSSQTMKGNAGRNRQRGKTGMFEVQERWRHPLVPCLVGRGLGFPWSVCLWGSYTKGLCGLPPVWGHRYEVKVGHSSKELLESPGHGWLSNVPHLEKACLSMEGVTRISVTRLARQGPGQGHVCPRQLKGWLWCHPVPGSKTALLYNHGFFAFLR